MQKITVLLADDHTVVRQGLRALLETEEDMTVAGEAENGRQAVQMAKRLQPDVVVMDIAMPSLNGLEATRQISRESPKSKVLILSSYSDDENEHFGFGAFLADLPGGLQTVERGHRDVHDD